MTDKTRRSPLVNYYMSLPDCYALKSAFREALWHEKPEELEASIAALDARIGSEQTEQFVVAEVLELKANPKYKAKKAILAGLGITGDQGYVKAKWNELCSTCF